MDIATASTHAVAASLSANLPYDPIKEERLENTLSQSIA
jgi:hypothetical protein